MHKVFVFARELLAIEEQKLCPIKPDSLGTIFQRERNLVGKFNVCEQSDPHPIDRFGWGIPLGEQLRHPRVLGLGLLLVIVDHPRTWAEDDFATVSVDDQQIASAHRFGDVVEPDHGRNAKGLGQNRSVRRSSARVRDQRRDLMPVQVNRIGGRQVMRDDHGPKRRLPRRATALIKQVAQHLFTDEGDIALRSRK